MNLSNDWFSGAAVGFTVSVIFFALAVYLFDSEAPKIEFKCLEETVKDKMFLQEGNAKLLQIDQDSYRCYKGQGS